MRGEGGGSRGAQVIPKLEAKHTSRARGTALVGSPVPPMLLSGLADGGPWPCEEKGCPNASVSCTFLAKEGACAHPFASIWERSPPSIASLKVREGCP